MVYASKSYPINNTLEQLYQLWLLWLNGLSAGLQTEKLRIRFLVRTRACVAGQLPSWGCARDNQMMLLFLPYAHASPLSKNKIIIKK